MIIKIDCREKGLLEECKKHDLSFITITSENIPLGDIIIYDDAGNEKIIIERKTLADLAASIRDGRYKEQGFRLQECSLHNHNIIYVIEGDLRYYQPFKGSIDKKALISSMVSINYFKGFSLFRTFNLAETAEWLIQLAKKLHKEGSSPPFYASATGASAAAGAAGATAASATADTATASAIATDASVAEDTGADNYPSAMKRVKKENINIGNIGVIMLSQIPGVSNAAAVAVMEKYSTIQHLIQVLMQDEHALKNIAITDKSGNLRKINKTCILNIYKFLLVQQL